MNHEDYEKAANYWKEKDADNVCMPEERTDYLIHIHYFLVTTMNNIPQFFYHRRMHTSDDVLHLDAIIVFFLLLLQRL